MGIYGKEIYIKMLHDIALEEDSWPAVYAGTILQHFYSSKQMDQVGYV